MSQSSHPPVDPASLAAIYDHAQRCFPRECCGYLSLDAEGRWQVTPCENQQDRLHALDPEQHPRDATTAYYIGGKELLTMVRSFDGPCPCRMIYHSHPSGGAYFSQTDKAGALAAGYPVEYLVVDVQGQVAREARLFVQGTGQDFLEIARYDAQGRLCATS